MATQEDWQKFALSPATSAFLSTKGPILRALLALGCQYGPMHEGAMAVAAADASLTALVAAIGAASRAGALDARGPLGQFVADAFLSR